MKKLLALALVALLASASQAVSTVWTGEGPYNTSSYYTFSPNIYANCAGLATATVALGTDYSSTTTATVLSLTSGGSTSANYAYVTLIPDGNGAYTLGFTCRSAATGTVQNYGSSVKISAGDTAKVGLYISRVKADGSSGYVVALYYNGEVIASYEGTVSYSGPVNRVTINGSDTLTISDVTVYQGTTAEASTIQAYAVSYTTPEPTALALLALGVAGLALKRRAA